MAQDPQFKGFNKRALSANPIKLLSLLFDVVIHTTIAAIRLDACT